MRIKSVIIKSDSGKEYTVSFDGNISCTCKDFIMRKHKEEKFCKHIDSVKDKLTNS